MKLKKHYRIRLRRNAQGGHDYLGQYRNVWSVLWHNVVTPDCFDIFDDEISARIACQNHARGMRYRKVSEVTLTKLGLL